MAGVGKTRALVVLGTVGAVAVVGFALWFAHGGGSAPDETEPALAGYAPSAPATGSMLRYETEYPTIPYTTGKRTDRVAVLIDKLGRGETQLRHEGERGYLESLLEALETSIESLLHAWPPPSTSR